MKHLRRRARRSDPLTGATPAQLSEIATLERAVRIIEEMLHD